MIGRLFREHPQSLGETYLQHFGVAAGFASSLIIAGIACFIHAIIPCLFMTTASRTVNRLSAAMPTGHRTRDGKE